MTTSGHGPNVTWYHYTKITILRHFFSSELSWTFRQLGIVQIFGVCDLQSDMFMSDFIAIGEIFKHSINKKLPKTVSSGFLAVKHQGLGDNGRRFEPRKRSKLFQ